jgi:hypothetical protein
MVLNNSVVLVIKTLCNNEHINLLFQSLFQNRLSIIQLVLVSILIVRIRPKILKTNFMDSIFIVAEIMKAVLLGNKKPTEAGFLNFKVNTMNTTQS